MFFDFVAYSETSGPTEKTKIQKLLHSGYVMSWNMVAQALKILFNGHSNQIFPANGKHARWPIKTVWAYELLDGQFCTMYERQML